MVVAVEVVVVPEELELLDESSSFAQEMRVRLKNVAVSYTHLTLPTT